MHKKQRNDTFQEYIPTRARLEKIVTWYKSLAEKSHKETGSHRETNFYEECLHKKRSFYTVI